MDRCWWGKEHRATRYCIFATSVLPSRWSWSGSRACNSPCSQAYTRQSRSCRAMIPAFASVFKYQSTCLWGCLYTVLAAVHVSPCCQAFLTISGFPAHWHFRPASMQWVEEFRPRDLFFTHSGVGPGVTIPLSSIERHHTLPGPGWKSLLDNESSRPPDVKADYCGPETFRCLLFLMFVFWKQDN